ncbi:MAG: hypothetical protein GC145_06260 [Caulobacter sp.]|nr:hypothetical protein [Caulobacter sp.]
MTDDAALADWLSEAGRTPHVWGRFDCSLGLVGGWVERVSGVNPGRRLIGRYCSEAGAALLVQKHGGLRALYGELLEGAGLSRVDLEGETPVAGDVGLVEVITEDGRRPVGAICTGRRWAVLTEMGLRAAPARPLAAWRLEGFNVE